VPVLLTVLSAPVKPTLPRILNLLTMAEVPAAPKLLRGLALPTVSALLRTLARFAPADTVANVAEATVTVSDNNVHPGTVAQPDTRVVSAPLTVAVVVDTALAAAMAVTRVVPSTEGRALFNGEDKKTNAINDRLRNETILW